ncbi:protein LITTLE ZIPPER 1-like isoform X2 [Corylus avellana]|uniref:protein LITTLE ZIPPER 1-like isoform X2 n=1 Tax=Corylus avellana TaxID=13451 RepID=UPI00286A87BC|nr:protein LITTLE ZIPPER 1-like isoform X2 [Corylus avellana]XP_059444870.1 protein LITTLE ZIPPER 1-like isoform X2 [Corylus avellana]
MCINNNIEKIPSGLVLSLERKQRSKRSKVQVHRLTRKGCEEKVEKDMELKNLKLYLENKSIIEENEKLRKKASLLHQENLALMYELQKKFPHLDSFSSTLVHKH